MNVNDVDITLIRKYDARGPRYTSYPTAASFRELEGEDSWDPESYIEKRNQISRPVSIYVHVPFCFSLCWYCGCTKIITKDTGRGDIYIDYLEKEMNLIARRMHPDSEVIQIHFGGGTPTFLKPDQLKRLGNIIHRRFNTSTNTEFGVEIDPRRCTEEHIEALRSIGCNRASLGVQDTNPEVQEAVHRIQPFEKTKEVTCWLHREGIHSINFDLIYGLPKQTMQTFSKSMEDARSLNPDRLAVYSYAHLPGLFPAQNLLNINQMPSTEEKLNLLLASIHYFTTNGYRYIGMDHFSKENDELSHALDNGTLQRNFQGYSTHAGADLYAFGMSGISNVGSGYWQNTKDLASYYEHLNNNEIPVFRGLKLSRDDMIRKNVIMNVMCKRIIDLESIEKNWNIDFKEYFSNEMIQLEEPVGDGLITKEDSLLKINESGRLFLRNVAMIFDRYHSTFSTERQFSKTI